MFDLSNACLGVLNGIVEVANRIELGQVRAGLVVSCETAREINDAMIEELIRAVGKADGPPKTKGTVPFSDRAGNMDKFRTTLATFTGGSGAVAVLVTDGSFSRPPRRRLVGGTTHSAPQHNGLCRWGLEGVWNAARQIMFTDSVAVLRYGVELGLRTWKAFLTRLGWLPSSVDKVICHQVGSGHRDSILHTLGISPDKDYSTYSYLGNMGTVSLPLTAALAEERAFLRPGDRVGLLGIGSGLNCLMLGVEW